MAYAYPADELRPLSCLPTKSRIQGTPEQVDLVKNRYNEVERQLTPGTHKLREAQTPQGDPRADYFALGHFQLTVVDGLDTLYAVGEIELWKQQIRMLVKSLSFSTYKSVSVFETNIRILGGLLSNYFLCLDEEMYDEAGKMLGLAVDLGDRLVVAFYSNSGVPFPTVNLIDPAVSNSPQTDIASVSTFILEFATLSRISGSRIYEDCARHALAMILKDTVNDVMMGTNASPFTGKLTTRAPTSVGPGVDSFYEYLMKAYILLEDDFYLDTFIDQYKKAMTHALFDGSHMANVDYNGNIAGHGLSALTAFWPGMQVLAGDIASATSIFNDFYKINVETGHGMLPETMDFCGASSIDSTKHLRPEYIESAWMLYYATKDPIYLTVGKELIQVLNIQHRTKCGFAMLRRTTKGDEMQSFYLAEVLKYLYLLFDPKNPMNTRNYVYTTEAHPIPVGELYVHPKVTIQMPSDAVMQSEHGRKLLQQRKDQDLYMRFSNGGTKSETKIEDTGDLGKNNEKTIDTNNKQEETKDTTTVVVGEGGISNIPYVLDSDEEDHNFVMTTQRKPPTKTVKTNNFKPTRKTKKDTSGLPETFGIRYLQSIHKTWKDEEMIKQRKNKVCARQPAHTPGFNLYMYIPSSVHTSPEKTQILESNKYNLKLPTQGKTLKAVTLNAKTLKSNDKENKNTIEEVEVLDVLARPTKWVDSSPILPKTPRLECPKLDSIYYYTTNNFGKLKATKLQCDLSTPLKNLEKHCKSTGAFEFY